MTQFSGKLRTVWCLAATVLLLVCPLVAYAATEQSPVPASQESTTAPGLDEQLGKYLPLDTTFLDESGASIRLRDLITGPTIILPVYYNCTNVCNTLQGEMARVLPGIKQKPDQEYRVISVSFDEHETPALATRFKKMYLTSMHAPYPEHGWRFLTGDARNIHALTDAAGYHFMRSGRDFVHPVASIIVARDGKIIRYLYGTHFLPKDLSLALMEADQGRQGASVRTVMDFCFSFDPVGKTYVFNLLRVSATVVIITILCFVAFLFLTGKKQRLRPRRDI